MPGRSLTSLGLAATMPRATPAATTAREAGWSEPNPHATATASNSFSSTPGAGKTSTTVGAPTVTVPVLSRISVSTSEACSKKSELFTRMRKRVATLIAAITAAGPATTRAVGVAATSTAIARERSRVKNSVVAATANTRGSQTPARFSNKRSTGTDVLSTSAKSWTTRPRTVSVPTPRRSSIVVRHEVQLYCMYELAARPATGRDGPRVCATNATKCAARRRGPSHRADRKQAHVRLGRHRA